MKYRLFSVLVIVAMVASLCLITAAPASAAAPSNVSVSLSSDKAASGSQYAITFQTSSSGALTANTSEISITFPSGTGMPSSAPDYRTVTVGTPGGTATQLSSAAAISMTGNTITLITPVSVANSGTVTVTFAQAAGIVNPNVSSMASEGTTYKVTVSTTSDTTPAQSTAYTINDWITATPTSAAFQDPITVTGYGFKPGQSVWLVANEGVNYYGATSLGTAEVGTDGSFTVTGFATGFEGVVKAKDGSGRSATTSTAITVLPRLVVSPTSGLVGSSVTLIAYDILHHENMPTGITIGGDSWITSMPTYAQLTDVDYDGLSDDYTWSSTIPTNLTAGVKDIVMVSQTGTGNASATFQVSPQAITVDPSNGAGGTKVVISGSGFAPNTTYTQTALAGIFFVKDPRNPLADPMLSTGTTIQTDGTGSFVVTGTVPSDAQAGTYGIQVILGSAMESGIFTVTSRSLNVEPASGPFGTKILVSGATNLVGSSGTLTIGSYSTTVTINQPEGSVTPKSVTVQSSTGFAQGNNTLRVSSTSGGSTTTATGIFQVVRPTLTLEPANAARGAQVTATGSGWVPGQTGLVTITLGGQNVAYATPDSSGDVWATFKVPSSLTAGSTVSFSGSDNWGNSSITDTFIVGQPELTLDPTSGPVGTEVTVTGSGFLPLTGVASITMNGINVVPQGTLITDSAGGFQTTFTVPGFDTGGYAVVATVQGSASTSFTITEGAAAATTPADGFATISDFIVNAWTFDGASQSWLVYDPTPGAPSSMEVLNTGQGYVVNVTEDCTLTYGNNTYNLTAGWNTIGWLG